MNENELRTIEENELDDIQLYDNRTVETEEDDGPGFGLGVLIGSAIGVGATLAFTKVKNYLWDKKVRNQRTHQEEPVTEAEQTVINDPNGTKGTTELDTNANKAKK